MELVCHLGLFGSSTLWRRIHMYMCTRNIIQEMYSSSYFVLLLNNFQYNTGKPKRNAELSAQYIYFMLLAVFLKHLGKSSNSKWEQPKLLRVTKMLGNRYITVNISSGSSLYSICMRRATEFCSSLKSSSSSYGPSNHITREEIIHEPILTNRLK